MKAALLALLALSAYGQTLSISGPASLRQGTSATYTINLSGSSGTNLSALGWTLSAPTGISFSAITVAAPGTSFAAIANGPKMVVIGDVNNVLSQATLQDGPIATVTLTAAFSASRGAGSLALSNIVGSSLAGSAVSVTSTASPISITTSCAVTGDTPTSPADVMAVLDGFLGIASCPASLSTVGGCSINNAQVVLNSAMGLACTLP